MSFSNRKKITSSRSLQGKGGILVGGKEKSIMLRNGVVEFKNIFGKVVTEVKVNRRS